MGVEVKRQSEREGRSVIGAMDDDDDAAGCGCALPWFRSFRCRVRMCVCVCLHTYDDDGCMGRMCNQNSSKSIFRTYIVGKKNNSQCVGGEMESRPACSMKQL